MGVGHGDVDESGAGDVQLVEHRPVVEGVDDVLGQVARVPPHPLRRAESAVALVLGELGSLRRDDETRRPFDADGGERVAESLGEI